MTSSLVGSEMCIRDSHNVNPLESMFYTVPAVPDLGTPTQVAYQTPWTVSYTHLTLPTICSV
eukprot:12210082-Prorocentrum_lima.AAC.1